MSANEPRSRFPKMKNALVVIVACLFSSVAAADVTVYEKAPTPEELQQKLLGGGKAEQKKFKTRAIVFGDSAPTEAAPAPQQAVAPSPAPQAMPTQAPAMATAAPQPAAAAQSVQASDDAIAFPIQFKVNSAQILPESIPFLQSIAGLMQKDPSIRLLVEGHTDISGSYQRNMTLSRERAYSVTNYLIDHFGIDPSRLMPVGKGPMEPLPGREPTDPKNRRVQFRILG
ncbi:OmpA family protein [Sulfuricystis multivorans]|uniref:OmpA family protein n=1 Tax=Sulfuricystis multivorans TaxID=2211108 RepID=UPI000F82A00E|nr:OmpA family protein [Sulfuricystis multivorans]